MSSQTINVPKKSASGADLGSLSLSSDQIDRRVRYQLLKDAVVMYRANRRQGTHSTKTRAAVAGSRKKLWRQKGTGRARPGNKQNPVWRGGGVAFGPHPRDYSYSINRKQKKLATRSALLSKFLDGGVTVVDSVEATGKTRDAAKMLEALGVTGRCLIGTGAPDALLVRGVRNIPRVKAVPVGDFNAEDILTARHILLTQEAYDQLLAAVSAPAAVSAAEAAEADGSKEAE